MKKEKRPCLFCGGFKLNKFNLLLIVLMCLAIYWVNQYQMHQIDEKQKSHQILKKANP